MNKKQYDQPNKKESNLSELWNRDTVPKSVSEIEE